jgi:hypothetical protein
MLMLVGEHGGDPMFPYVAMMKALRQASADSDGCTAKETGQGVPDHSIAVIPRSTLQPLVPRDRRGAGTNQGARAHALDLAYCR